ncbi:MAG: hypothetical protein BWY65_01675 [Firmicutes bacterium ADurb.Bin373]|nr:MAG: hypothetical protein BWY65_01675 [Firmicutes bacterium ADurb.Bin373]
MLCAAIFPAKIDCKTAKGFPRNLSKYWIMWWISDETSGYGVCGTAYYLTDEGFYGGVPHDGCDPKVLTEKEYEEALKAIDGEEFDENECDDEIIEIVQAGSLGALNISV